MKVSPYEAHWSDTRNWKWHLFYICKADPRIIVPKRPEWMGRTLNFAHMHAYLVLLLTIIFLSVPFLLLAWVGTKIAIVLFLGILAATLVFYYSYELRINENSDGRGRMHETGR